MYLFPNTFNLSEVYQCFPRPKIFIEQKALDTIAHLCDGDARTGLNSLQLAVQAQLNLAQFNSAGHDGSQEILVKEEHIKEGLQRSHILYDKAGKFTRSCLTKWQVLQTKVMHLTCGVYSLVHCCLGVMCTFCLCKTNGGY